MDRADTPAYCAGMSVLAFRERVAEAMKSLGWTKAELSRQSGVPYHTLDKFLKGVSDKTSAENAQQLARALGIRVDEDAEYEELRRLFYSATDTDRRFVLETVRRLVAGMQKDQK